jgi:hypothetical protein
MFFLFHAVIQKDSRKSEKWKIISDKAQEKPTAEDFRRFVVPVLFKTAKPEKRPQLDCSGAHSATVPLSR